MPDMVKRLSDRICMVTGATSGIGAATAKSLVQQGATVIIVGRDLKKCNDTVQRIKRADKHASIDFIVADLSLQKHVHQCAAQFKQNHHRLDILINNAGARFLSRLQTAEGFEMNFALNYLGPFLLTQLLLKELNASSRGRIINVASEAHRACPGINFDDLQYHKRYSGKEAYAQSKLASLLTTYEMARRLEGTRVTVNALEPGNVVTNFSRNNGLISWARHIVGSFMHGKVVWPKEGAKTSIYLASSPDVEGTSGQYFSKRQAVRSSDVSYDGDVARRLWQLSLDLTSLKTDKREKMNLCEFRVL
jgi:NAD(P)-dependent dehydrogenase (short-subunit alcohol dehydrogenase family)